MDMRNESGAARNGSHFAGFPDASVALRRLAAPRAPVPARGHEVPVRGCRLCPGGRPVAEEVARERAHLEETEVLAVLGGRLQPRLAPGDIDGLAAVVAERSADRFSR